jgi:type IV pilus assembly protein PilY1
LRQQSIISESQQFRVTTANALENDDRGWYLDLVSPVAGFGGERVVSDPVLRGGRIIFTTFMPKADACEGGSDGWLMELGSDSGARFIAPVIDTNGDGVYDDRDKIDGKTVSGVRGEDGAPLVPSIVTDQKGDEKKHLQGAGGGLPQEVGERGALARGRTSWRQFWP